MHTENDLARSQGEQPKQKSSKSDVKRLGFAQNFRDPPEFPYFPSHDTGGGACLHCGAPFAPDDDSYHYRFGEWREGPDPHAHHITGRAQDQAQSASTVAGSAAVTGPGDQHGAAARIQAALRGWRGYGNISMK